MKVFVTGGTGFIGSHLVDRLVNDGHKVTVYDNYSTGKMENRNMGAVQISDDIRNYAHLYRAMEKSNPDIVFHLAAEASVERSMLYPGSHVANNIEGTVNVLQCAKAMEIKRFIFASSCVAKYNPESIYGLSKRVSEDFIKFYRKHFNYQILRYGNVFGPRQDEDMGVVAKFANQMLRYEMPTVYGDGFSRRDYIYVDDVVEANIRAMLTEHTNRAYLIGTGKTRTVLDVLKAIKKVLNHDKSEGTKAQFSLLYKEKRLGDIQGAIWLDVAPSIIMGFEYKHGFFQSIRKTVEWYEERMK